MVIPAYSHMQLTTIIYDVTDTSATFEFMVGIPIVSNHPMLYLEYGLDERYGNSIPIELKHETMGGLAVTFPATLTNLAPGTKYHYHLVIKDIKAKINIHSMDSDFITGTKKKQSL